MGPWGFPFAPMQGEFNGTFLPRKRSIAIRGRLFKNSMQLVPVTVLYTGNDMRKSRTFFLNFRFLCVQNAFRKYGTIVMQPEQQREVRL
ncbi:MAG: hypothetical protein C4576_23565 [Desulfobacteraceae bacterium]|nr:MAG: hypothetical protein C4576_23565 [Desulfobacteraceae bacterium]